jgi:hypothetical protein
MNLLSDVRMNMNERTIKYTVKENNFRYHVKKCVMESDGCIISKSSHPITEVETMKEKMLKAGILEELPTGYELKKDYKTGFLMAYNLCSDKIKNKLDSSPDIIINGKEGCDEDIKDYFAIDNVSSTESYFGNMMRKDELKLEKIEKIYFDKIFLNRMQSKDFSKAEEFVVECLVEAGIIKEYRRGDDSLHEADVIIEREGRQIEIVSDFNAANDVLRFKKKAPEMTMILDAVDTGHYASTKGLMKKFYKKNYCNKYNLELAILMMGNETTASEMIELIKDEILKNGVPKNQFQALHFIILNAISDNVKCVSGENVITIPIEKVCVKPYQKDIVELENIKGEDEYLMTCESLFENKKALMCLTGKEIMRKIKEMGIWM